MLSLARALGPYLRARAIKTVLPRRVPADDLGVAGGLSEDRVVAGILYESRMRPLPTLRSKKAQNESPRLAR